ncbi:MAG: hypothetical protein HRU41_08695 [Saprospiraceae bacterium]|nr:hypothetical protein [Saprospiraceae bacterium]
MHPTLQLLLCSYFCMATQLALAEHAIIPIKLIDKLILIEGTVEDQTGYFILDLGASDIILNSRYYKGRLEKPAEAFGINGTVSAVEKTWASANFGGVQWKRYLTHILSLKHLEKAKGVKILGLVGGKFFRHCQLLIDLSKMEIEIVRGTTNGTYDLLGDQFSEPDAIIPFKYKGGMPWIEVRIASTSFKFGLDTASEFSLMDTKWLPLVEDLLFNRRQVITRGISAQTKSVLRGKLAQLEIGSLACYPMSTLFTNMSIINRNLAGAKLDGLLGFDLLRQFKVLVNYDHKDIMIWRHKLAKSYPLILTQVKQKDVLRIK